jgi:hypothetical protein
MPKTLGDTEKFMKGGDSGQLKSSLKGNVSQQTDKSAGGVESASKEAPKEGGVPTKATQAIPGEAAPPAPAVDGAEAMPAAKPDSEVSLQASKADSDQAMKEAEVTPDQLKKANDPRFSAVLTSKDAVAKQADAAPGKFRAGEGAILGSAKAKAGAEAKKGATALLGVKAGSKSAVVARQEAAKAKEEAARKEVTDHIEGIYNKTKTKVEEKLNGLETEVGGIFDSGVDAAINAMKSYVEDKLFDYKVKRYLSIPLLGLAAWVRDQFKGLPDEVNVFYTAGRALFTRMMDALVVRVANLVETRLREAKAIVSAGRAEIATYVAGLPKNLQAVGQTAQKEVAGRFEELERGIDDKKSQLAQQLAQKYKEAFDKADEALKAIQDENKGLIDGFMEKLGEVIKILTEFKAKLMALLKKGEDAIKMVLADPIGFLGNLLAAIKQGFNQFVNNILTHLKKGFMTWLFGTLAEAGIEIPSDLTLPSILKLVMSVLGLTYERMRAEAVKLLGPTAVAIIEKLVEYVKVAIQGGPKALWEKVKEDLNSLKAMVIDAIQDWLITTIIKKAVAKVVTMFNPAGAIVQAVMMIYSVVTFIIERAAQIMALIEAIINSVQAIAQGAIGGAANWIEQALGRLVPVAIGLLASLIGLGGIGAKIRELVTKAGDLVWGAIRKFLKKAIDFVKKMFGKLTGKKEAKPDERTDAQKNSDLREALSEATNKLKEPKASSRKVRKSVAPIKSRFRLTRIELVGAGKSGTKESFYIEAEINPRGKTDPKDFVVGMQEVKVAFNIRLAKFDPVPFRGQLRQQERGIRAMKMNAWSSNRGQFLATKAAAGPGGSGRSEMSAEDQSKFRELMRTRIVERRTQQAVKRGVPAAQALKDAEIFADNWMSSRAALHAPDQIAGGGRIAGDIGPISTADLSEFKERTGLTGMGEARINSSIGSQWKSRIGEIDKEVNSDKYTPDDKKEFNMNVILEGVEI